MRLANTRSEERQWGNLKRPFDDDDILQCRVVFHFLYGKIRSDRQMAAAAAAAVAESDRERTAGRRLIDAPSRCRLGARVKELHFGSDGRTDGRFSSRVRACALSGGEPELSAERESSARR